MSDRKPRLTGKQILTALYRAGWEQVGRQGSHVQLKHAARSGRVTVMDTTAIIKPGTLRSIEQQSGLTAQQMKDLL